MIWVLVFGGIALAGLIMVVCYAVWLWHKASDVMAEVTVVLDRLGQLGDLAGQIKLPDSLGGGYPVVRSDGTWDDEWEDEDDEDDSPTASGDDAIAIAEATHARRARVGD